MQIQSVAQLIPVLQTAIGPAILISGIGLLLLTMTNRLSRTVDRARILTDELNAGGKEGPLRAQLVVLWRRSRILQASIVLASMSALCAALRHEPAPRRLLVGRVGV